MKGQLDEWLRAAGIARGRIFRRVTRMGLTWGDCMTEKSIWHIVKDCANRIGMPKLAPHDLRRTCARLCHASGGELEQIQFLLGHVSVQTTERYLGCKRGFGRRSMIASESNQIPESPRFWKSCRQPDLNRVNEF